jgi:hypothetical protein
MSTNKRKSIASGIILILIGLVFLALQLIPGLRFWADQSFTWPMSIIAVAFGLLVIGALTGTADMLVPACIVGGIGGILYLQNSSVLTWESWAYLWTLIPGFAGVGVFLAGLIKWNKKEIVDGIQTTLVSGVLLLVFGSLMGDMFGKFPMRDYLPFVLIALGLFLFVRALFDRRH